MDDAAAHVGCLIEVRIIGIIKAEQTEDGKTKSNDRLLGVAVHSYYHEDLESINDVSKTMLQEIQSDRNGRAEEGSDVSCDSRRHPPLLGA